MIRLDENSLHRVLEILRTILENTTVTIEEIPPQPQQSGQPVQSNPIVTTNPISLELSDMINSMYYDYDTTNNKIDIQIYIAYNSCGATVNVTYDVNAGVLYPLRDTVLYERVWQNKSWAVIPRYKVSFSLPNFGSVLQEIFPPKTITNSQQLFFLTLSEIDSLLKSSNYPADAIIISRAIDQAISLTGIPRDYFWMFLSMVIYERGLPKNVLDTVKLLFPTLLETIKESKLILSMSPEEISEILHKSVSTLRTIVDSSRNRESIAKIVKIEIISEMIPQKLSGPVRVVDLKNYVEELFKIHALLLALPGKLRTHLDVIGSNIKTIIDEIKKDIAINEAGVLKLYQTVVNSLKSVNLSKLNDLIARPPLNSFLSSIDFSAVLPNTPAEIFDALRAIHDDNAFEKLVDEIASESHFEVIGELENLYIYLSRFVAPGYIESVKVDLKNRTAASQLEEIKLVFLYNKPCSVVNGDIVAALLQRTEDTEIVLGNRYFRVSNLWAIGERPYERREEDGKSQSYKYRVYTAELQGFHVEQGIYPGELRLSYVKGGEYVLGDYTTITEVLKVLPNLQDEYYIGVSSTSKFPYKKVDSEYELLSLLKSVASNISTIAFISPEYMPGQQEEVQRSERLNVFSELGAAYLSMLAEKAEYIYKNRGVVDYDILREHLTEFLSNLKINSNIGKRDPFLLQKVGKDSLVILIREILAELAEHLYRKYADKDYNYAVNLAVFVRSLTRRPIHIHLVKGEGSGEIPYVVRIVIEVTDRTEDNITIDIPVTAVKKDYLLTPDNYNTAISNLIQTFRAVLPELIDEKEASSSGLSSVSPGYENIQQAKPFSVQIDNSDIQLVISLLPYVVDKLVEILQGKLGKSEGNKKPITYGIALPYIVLTVNLAGGKKVTAKILITKELIDRFKKYRHSLTPSPDGLRKANEILLDICKDFEKAIEYYAKKLEEERAFTIESISNTLGKNYHTYIVNLLQEAISKAFPASASKGVLLSQEEFDKIVREIEKKVEEKYSKISDQNQQKIEEILDRIISQAIDKKILDLASYFLKERR